MSVDVEREERWPCARHLPGSDQENMEAQRRGVVRECTVVCSSGLDVSAGAPFDGREGGERRWGDR